jgi:hypothetical protein
MKLIKREIGWYVQLPLHVKQVTGNPMTTYHPYYIYNFLSHYIPQAVNCLKCNVMKDDYINNNKLH